MLTRRAGGVEHGSGLIQQSDGPGEREGVPIGVRGAYRCEGHGLPGERFQPVDSDHRARGEDASPVVAHRPAQSVGREHTYETDTGHRPTLLATLSLLSERVGAALRREGKRARRVTLKLRYSDFKTVTRATALAVPTDDDRTLYRAVAAALQAAYTRRVRARLVGLTASGLCSGGWLELDLFEGRREERLERLTSVLDQIRDRHGFHAILRARSWEAGKTRGG